MSRTGRTKRFAILVLGVAALAASSVAFASPTAALSGKYAATIKSPAELKGKWVVTFAKGGTYSVALNGRAMARGTYSATATTITMREPAGCGGTGTYGWRKSGKTLTFVRKREAPACQARAAVLAHRFTQVR
jgi:hypothetical protein